MMVSGSWLLSVFRDKIHYFLEINPQDILHLSKKEKVLY